MTISAAYQMQLMIIEFNNSYVYHQVIKFLRTQVGLPVTPLPSLGEGSLSTTLEIVQGIYDLGNQLRIGA